MTRHLQPSKIGGIRNHAHIVFFFFYACTHVTRSLHLHLTSLLSLLTVAHFLAPQLTYPLDPQYNVLLSHLSVMKKCTILN